MNKYKILTLLLLFSISIFSQEITRVQPPNWWTNMKYNHVEILVYGKDIATLNPVIADTQVEIEKVSRTRNQNYLFITLNLENANPGTLPIQFLNKKGRKKLVYEFEIKERNNESITKKGFDSSDVIYLITPDRFVNGDVTNDIDTSLLEKTINRKDNYARHGGDIRGIIKSLDYIDSMGFTAIWSCPLLINDMPKSSYHGYAMTDFYSVDSRYGTLEEYIELSVKAKEKGIKLIMDQVANHIGSEHWWMKDLPSKNWINYQEEFENNEKVPFSNHRRTTNQDQYASNIDSEGMSNGWFVSAMPDMNQQNPLLATYLIQNSIWWVETLDLGGIRQDTYPYPDKGFMSEWAKAIMNEYPEFSIVGEEWSYNPLLVGYWQQGAKNKDGYESHLTSPMDFPMQGAIVEALNEDESWDKGFVKIYEGLANDFYYANPSKLMVFPDNHDMDRVFTQLNENVVNTKMAMAYLLTLPRIPQIYYGTEILMQNSAKRGDHGLIRTDFPGGWDGDTVDAFTGKGLDDTQLEMQSFVKKLLNYRKNSKAIHEGKTLHFAPSESVYILTRSFEDETVIVILNKNEEPYNLKLDRFNELNLNGKKVTNIISNDSFIWNDTILLKEKGVTILSTKF